VSAVQGLSFDGVEAIVKDATEHRAALLLRGDGLDARVSDVDPHDVARVHECKPLAPEAERTAAAVNKFVRKSYEILSQHPINKKRREQGLPEANILLPRGAGPFPDIQPFEEKWGLTASCVAGVSLIRGICRTCGLEVVEPAGVTGGLDTNMEAKARAALAELARKDFVLMNVKATDVASHDGDPVKKVAVIERIDGLAKIIREGAPPGTVVVLTADHCTPCARFDHSGDPVPLCIWSEDTLKDGSQSYDEVTCSKGGLGRIRGKDLMPILFDKTDRSEKFGA